MKRVEHKQQQRVKEHRTTAEYWTCGIVSSHVCRPQVSTPLPLRCEAAYEVTAAQEEKATRTPEYRINRSIDRQINR